MAGISCGKFAAGAAAFTLLAACASAPIGAPHGPITIPFERDGQGHIIVPVTIAGASGYALLDNGAFASVIDTGFASEHGLKAAEASGGWQFATTTSIALGAVTETVTPVLLDLSSQPGGRGLQAVVGEEFFERHVVEIDFVSKEITLHDRRTFIPPFDLTALKLTSPPDTGKATLPAAIEGEAGHVVTFDLGGAGFTLIYDRKLAKRLLADGRGSIPASLGNTRAGKYVEVKGRTISLTTFTFGGFTIADVPTVILDQDYLPDADIDLDIGVLSRFHLILDIGGGRIWMRPNADFADSFGQDLVGLELSLRPTPGNLLIDAVTPGSPAEAAGFAVGDVVVKVNGQLPTVPNLDAARPRKPGDKVEVELEDGRRITVTAARFY